MIIVHYAPAGEGAPIGFDQETRTREFETHADFRDWLPTYVCGSCVKDGADFDDRELSTVRDYMSTGCGCEIWIEDPDDIIHWDDVILDPNTKQAYVNIEE